MEVNHGERIIVLVDMDCFYVQVEQKLDSNYENKPCAVVQYNTWKGGGIIAVNYEARAHGVKRGMRGDEAQRQCPDIHLFRVPEVRGKADLTRYREAGASVLDVLCEFSDCVERASIDEAYLDMTAVISKKLSTAVPVLSSQLPNTYVVGWEDENEDNKSNKKDNLESWLHMIYEEDHLFNDRMLALTGVIVEEMRMAVFTKTGYRCSAGIAHNKMLAKLSCGLHKPNKQTLLPQSSIPLLYSTISVTKVRNLGGKFGEEVVEKLKAKTMGDLQNIPEAQFHSLFGEKNGSWLYNISRGIEHEPVTARQLPKSIGCGKNFPGKSSLNTKDKVTHWLKQLSIELEERLVKDQENNCRVARSMTVTVRNSGSKGFSIISRTCPIYVYDSGRLANDAFNVLQKLNSVPPSSTEWKPPILSLALSANKFEDKIDNMCDIQSYFGPSAKTADELQKRSENVIETNLATHSTGGSITTNTPSKLTDKFIRPNTPSNTGIARFFNTQKSSLLCKKPDNADALQDDLKLDDDQVILSDTNITHNHKVLNLHELNSNDSANCLEISEKLLGDKSPSKVFKGFFATKLEEKNIAKKVNPQKQLSSFESEEHREKDDHNISTSISLKTLQNDIAVPSTSAQKQDESYMLPLSPINSTLDPELVKLCDKCSKQIPIWEEQEHLDYHVAYELSKEVNKSNLKPTEHSTNFRTSKINNSTKSKKTCIKRKSNNKSTQKSKKHLSLQTNTLDSFVR